MIPHASDSPSPDAQLAAGPRATDDRRPGASSRQRELMRSILAGVPEAEVSASESPRFAGKSPRTVREALRRWVGAFEQLDRGEISRHLNRLVGMIDEVINSQLNEILHHSRFQRLEAAWRGLNRLVTRVENEDTDEVKIKFLDVTWRELGRDFERSVDFDQSQLFIKIYEREFGTPGGQPFGILLGDYEISPQSTDVAVLQAISGVAAAAFCPFIASASPSMFGLDGFTDLQGSPDLARGFQLKEFLKWRAFRDTEDSKFVGLVLPRVLMRLPYVDEIQRADGFRFQEDVTQPGGDGFLWGNAAYAFGEVVVRAFAQSGWLARIRGVEQDVDAGGIVNDLPVHCFATDSTGIAPKCSTDVIVTDAQERDLSQFGFIPLCQGHDTEYSAFYSCESTQKSKKYSTAEATRNARITSMMHYTLCASRFAHYLKVLARDKIGGGTEASECERILHEWITQYVTPDADASPEVKARRPLREAQVQVRPHPAQPGSYQCSFHLWPHFELDDLVAAVRLNTELGPELRA
jgi:type VI secretion system protein ImpD